MKYANRVRDLSLLVAGWTILQSPGCLTMDEVSTQVGDSIRDFFTAVFQTGLGNLLDNVF